MLRPERQNRGDTAKCVIGRESGKPSTNSGVNYLFYVEQKVEPVSFDDLHKVEREVFEARYGKDDVCDRPPLTSTELKSLGQVRCVTPQMWAEGVTLRGGVTVKLEVLGWVRDGYVVRDRK